MDDLFNFCDEYENFDPNVEDTAGTSIRNNTVPCDEDERVNQFREWIANGLMSRS